MDFKPGDIVRERYQPGLFMCLQPPYVAVAKQGKDGDVVVVCEENGQAYGIVPEYFDLVDPLSAEIMKANGVVFQ